MLEQHTATAPPINPVELAKALGAQFAERRVEANEHDRFVAENFADLKQHRLVSAGVPVELGGGGASYSEMCELLRELAYSCSSTARLCHAHASSYDCRLALETSKCGGFSNGGNRG
jgi:alkylation response protein AidB-like acyl-CoA dehydrogenase